ncbi:kelch domain-containing protein 4 [Arctopsyche grandis]|uniref:kelch domain-containing protein 4 n=1 Tax=Arctopsyche grandis TaxID=121162 RepID=UPI00406D8C01
MGKKDKKKKVSGAVKTATKTEKKLESKRKKELADIGEEDIEEIVAKIEREEAKRLAVVETTVSPPSPRVNATLLPHPTNTSELILFGGEYHDGKKTYVYNNLFVYNIAKNEWRIIKAPGAPPPRSAHQAVTLSSNKGELWIFGGEYTSPTEMQFYHYKDLWLYSLSDKKWQKVESPGCPTSRSGHRMTSLRKQLIVFGGYHDNGRNYKYYNDLFVFCTDTRIWRKIETLGNGPCPRSACLLMPTGQDTLVVYGGYSRVKEGKADRGVTHGDLFRLVATTSSGPNSTQPTNYRWDSLKGGSQRPTPPRSSFSACLAPGNKCYVFGGVLDMEETEELLTGEMFNSLHCLELDNGVWRNVTFKPQKVAKIQKEGENKEVEEEEEEKVDDPITVCSDGIFTMTLSGAKSSADKGTANVVGNEGSSSVEGPCPRMNAMIAVQKSTLYLYGGILEKGEKQFTLSDMYCLDLHKLEGWKTLSSQPSLPEWLGSDSEEEGEEDEGSESEESGSEETESD